VAEHAALPASPEPVALSAMTPTQPAPASDAVAGAASDGVIVLPKEAADHRVFVDGRVVPVKSSRATVTCGAHEIRIGSHGTPQNVDVACGGETPVSLDARDR
jgi:hypothetical protein